MTSGSNNFFRYLRARGEGRLTSGSFLNYFKFQVQNSSRLVISDNFGSKSISGGFNPGISNFHVSEYETEGYFVSDTSSGFKFTLVTLG